MGNLPLQTVLTYQTCPSPAAASYLQALCCTEGYLVERDTLLNLYESTYTVNSIDLPDAPGIPANSQVSLPDLRRTIHHLQLWCVDTINTNPRSGEVEQWETSHGATNAASTSSATPQTRLDGYGADEDQTKPAAGPSTVGENEERGSLREFLRHADLISFADSHLMRNPVNSLQVYFICTNALITNTVSSS